MFSVYDPGSATKGATAVAGTTSVVPGHLYYVVGSYDGSTMRIYVNGVLEATAPRSGLLKPSTFGGALTSGGWGSRSSPAFAGRLDDIAIYHKALSAEAVRSHYLTGAPVTYGSTVLADSPVAFWRLGDAQGRVVADSSGNGNAISAVSGVRLAAPGLLKDSKTSAVFDGANAKMYFQSSESLRAGRRLSLEAWVRPSTLPRISGSGWLLVGLWDTALLYIQGGTAPKFVFSLYGPGSAAHKTTVVASTTTVAPGQVYYIVGSYDGSTMRIYVNGVPEASNAHSGPIQNPRSGGALVSGGWGKRPSPAFDGRLDDIAIYNKALSSARVRQHYMQASRS